jgi:hypothetical protein
LGTRCLGGARQVRSGGLSLALAGDMRIAVENAIFALPPARLGLSHPSDGLKDLFAGVPRTVTLSGSASRTVPNSTKRPVADTLRKGYLYTEQSNRRS